jgi:hypothetical protein
MKKEALTYSEFIALAKKNYCNGGMHFVECWEEYQFNDWVRLFGDITHKNAMEMFAYEVRNATTR